MGVKKVFKNIYAWLKAHVPGFEDLAKGALKALKSDLGKIALQAVQDAATVATTNQDAARKQAIAQVKADGKDLLAKAAADGKEVKDSFIALLVEAAVNKIKGTLDPKA